MINHSIQRLQWLTNTIPPLLSQISEADFAAKPLPNKWSKKEVLGHLIDSSTNNHQRFVRGQFEDMPAIQYDQNGWNEYSYYQEMDSRQLITFWTIYNQHLAAILQHIPAARLDRQVKVYEQPYTLIFLINDYVAHLEHHLRQIVVY